MKSYLGLIEMLFVFGSGVALVLWEIYSVRRKPAKQIADRDADDGDALPPEDVG